MSIKELSAWELDGLPSLVAFLEGRLAKTRKLSNDHLEANTYAVQERRQIRRSIPFKEIQDAESLPRRLKESLELYLIQPNTINEINNSKNDIIIDEGFTDLDHKDDNKIGLSRSYQTLSDSHVVVNSIKNKRSINLDRVSDSNIDGKSYFSKTEHNHDNIIERPKKIQKINKVR